MATEMLFTDPDGDGQGDWSTDASTPIGDLASRTYVDSAVAAVKFSPAFSGVPTAPTAAPGTNTVQIANTAFVTAATAAVDVDLDALAASVLKIVNVTGGQVLRGYTPGTVLPTAGMLPGDIAFVYTTAGS